MIQVQEIANRQAVMPSKIEMQAEGGVTSFNGRSGAVRPLSGDYTAAMVGADPKGSAATVEAKIPTKVSQLINDSNYATESFVENKIADIEEGAQGPAGPQGEPGKDGKNGITFTPSVSEDGELSWTNDGDLENPESVNIKGPKGDSGSTPYIGENENWFIDGVDTGHLAVGSNGVTFVPTVSEDGDLSWDNNGELANPSTVNLRGPQGEKGSPGVTFIPSVSEGGILEWENDGGLSNPSPVDIKGPQGPQGIQGEQGDVGQQGIQGPKGDPGEPFSIAKIYSSVLEMNEDFGNEDVKQGQFVIIETGSVEDEDNAKLYIKGETEYEYITDLSGAKGIEGPPGERGEQGVAGPQGPQGIQGEQGEPGEHGVPGEPGKNGTTFIPSVSSDGELSWTNDGELDNPEPVNIMGPQGPKGETGGQGETGPAGSPATINGKEAINIIEGNNITLEEDGEDLKISAIVPTAGQDMVETNGELNPKIPIRYLTLDEYNALTDNEKMADVQYIVDDGESETSEYKAEMVHSYSDGNFSIRECEDGYCEVTYFNSAQMNESQFQQGGSVGDMYIFSLDTAAIEMPFEFSQKYSEVASCEIHSSNNSPFPGIIQPICKENHLKNDLYLGDWVLLGNTSFGEPENYGDYTIEYAIKVTGMKAGA